MKAILGVIVFAMVLQVGYITYSMVGGNKENNDSPAQNTKGSQVQSATGDAIADDVETKKVDTKNSIDTSKVKVPDTVKGAINQYDSKNKSDDTDMFKLLSARVKIPQEYLAEIKNMLKKNYEFKDVMIAFDFLNRSYGLIKELEPILEQRKGGMEWADIFTQYNKNHKEFVPKDFKSGYLEDIMSKYNANTDDIMIADRLSQKGLGEFEGFIKRRASGEKWQDINVSLGVVNIADKLPRVSLTNAQIKKVIQDSKLSKDKAIEALVIANEMNIDSADVVKQYKDKDKKEEIYENCYDELYK